MRRKKLAAGAGNVAQICAEEKMGKIMSASLQAVQPIEIEDLDDWSDKYRELPTETSAEHGQWSTDRFPFLRRIMKCLSPSSIAKEIVSIKGSQLGFTEICLCWILYISKMNPGPSMYVQKTGDAAQDFSKQKLKPSIEICPAVADTLGDDKAKSLSNTWDNKGFPGGYVVLGGANSGPFLRSKSIRDAMLDEEDSYDANIDSEGSPVGMVRKRQQTFEDRKMYRLSTPKIKETSTIEPAYLRGSQEKYYLPCPRCGALFVLTWNLIKWNDERENDTNLPTDIWCECPHCAGRIDEHEKTWMLAKGAWMSEKGSEGEPYEVGDVEFPSFHISSLYSPYGFYMWRDAVKEWLEWEETGDVALLQVFINQTLGESFSLIGHEISYSYLFNRREVYSPDRDYDIPSGGLVVTAGTDVQKDRIECEVVAWGMFDENWSLDYVVFYGDTSDLGDREGLNSQGKPTVWRLLDEFLMKKYRHESGHPMGIECVTVDANYMSEPANIFCRVREDRRIFPLKGKYGWGEGYYRRPKKRHERYRTWSFLAFVDELKSKTYSMLRVEEPGPGYCHFPKRETYSEEHFKNMTSESLKTKIVSGKKRLGWELPAGARNEQLDCRNYAYTAYLIYNPDMAARARALSTPVAQVASRTETRPRRRRGSPGL
jgi:phage terminase large subunit GpA-like protein